MRSRPAWVILVSLTTGCVAPDTAIVAERSERAVVAVEQVVPQLAGMLSQQIERDERVQKAVAAVVDQRTANVWNDVRPWIRGGVATVAIVVVAAVIVLVVWIRLNSYLRQKPVYERTRAGG